MRRRIVVAAAAAVVIAGISVASLAFRDEQPAVPTERVVGASFARSVSAEGFLKAAKATPVTADPRVRGRLKIVDLAADGSRVKSGDVLVRFDPSEFEKRRDDSTSGLHTVNNRLASHDITTGVNASNLRRDAAQAQRELESARTFQKKDDGIFARNELIESALDEELALRKQTYAISVLGVRQQIAAAERGLIEIERKRAEFDINEAGLALRGVEVRAPHDGLFVLNRDWDGSIPRIGDVVWSGFPVGEIPDITKMNAEVFVLEADAAGLEVGQPVVVTIEAMADRTFPAKISAVDPVAKPRQRNVPVQFFSVTVEMEKTDVAVMKPGARVRALFRSGESKKALSVPRQAVFDKEGKKIVYRQSADGTFEATDVTLGLASLGRVVVTKGLNDGDVVALRDPGAMNGKKKEKAKS